MSVTNTTTPIRTTPAQWEKLQPAYHEDKSPTEMHGKLPPSVSYPAGQILGWKTASSYWAAPGAGVVPPYRILPYPYVTNASGYATIGPSGTPTTGSFVNLQATVPMYINGPFFVKDLTGLGADEVILNALGRLEQGVDHADVTAIVRLGGTPPA